MTRQQKIWKGTAAVLYSIRPLLLYLFLPGILMSLGMMVRRYSGSDAAFILESGNFYNFVSMLLILAYFGRASKKRGQAFWDEVTLYIKKPDRKEAEFWLVCLLFGASVGLFLSALFSLLPDWLLASYSERSAGIFNGRDLILVALTVGFLAPLTEEIVFRGYMLNRLMTFFSVRHSVILCAAFFAVCHVNVFWMLYALAMGFFLCWISLKKDNILYSVLVHVGFNLPSVVIAVIQSAGSAGEWFFGSRFLILLYGVIGAASGRLLYRKIRKGEE